MDAERVEKLIGLHADLEQAVREIPLTFGQIALIDAEDYESVSAYPWRAMRDETTGGWRAHTTVYDGNGKRHDIQMSHLVMRAEPGDQVDHRFHNTLDNRKANLRKCTQAQNNFNQRPRKGTSEYKGVSWEKRRCKWRAQIVYNYKNKFIGCFSSEVDAARAYDKVAHILFGEFAFLNFPAEVMA